ncbi:hypothetical protein ACQPYH_02025 [Kribbella sp. CA-245084]|uniref:hypothetical protein n=1 Tax=Kribbella sp. CA-245084 TaxID=3239940 RepID=UPI003D90937D
MTVTAQNPPAPAKFGTVGAYLAVLVMLALAMNELSLLSAGFLDANGQSWSFNEMSGPHPAARIEQWNLILTADQLKHWQELLGDYLFLDFLFIGTYTIALTRLLPWWAVAPLAILDVAENSVTAVLGHVQRCAGEDCVSDGLVTVLTWLTALKWLAVVALVAVGLAKVKDTSLGRIWRALYLQRFSLLAFLPIAALAVIPGSNVLDQMPDVQRRWLDSGTGLSHALLAGAVYLVVVLPAIFLLGRLRSDWAVRRVNGAAIMWPLYDGPCRTKPRRFDFRLWIIGPLLLPLIALVIQLAGRSLGTVFWLRLAIFCGIPLVVVVSSLLLRRFASPRPRSLRPIYPEYAHDVMAAGDALTVAALSLAGLGMIRAFTAPAALNRADMASAAHFPAWIALLIGAALTIAPWLVAGPVLGTIAGWATAGGARGWIGKLLTPGLDAKPDGGPLRWWRFGLLFGAVAGFVLLAAFPRPIADGVGVLAAVMLALSVLVVMVGLMVVAAQDRQPPELFQSLHQHLRTRSTPIITLLLIALIATGLAGGKNDIHPVIAAGTVPSRPSLQMAFDAMLRQPGCSVPFQAGDDLLRESRPAQLGTFSLRPMLILAAEGGGIRAAYWTAATLDRIGAAGNGCGGHSTLFSTGASGGALGMGIGRFTDQPLASVRTMSGHEALGAATISLLAGDLLASTTGVRFANKAPYREPVRQSLDRAGLMETRWEAMLAGFHGPFLASDPSTAAAEGSNAVTGQLILNTTATKDGCIALVSQVDLTEGARTAGNEPVCGSSGAGAHNYDFFGAYGRIDGDMPEDCVGDLPALSATMLANRFPYITPSGTAARCRGLEPAQLVDGGYTDNTGLGTVNDLAPQWTGLVEHHNDAVLAKGTGELVVPMVVYIENGTGPDYSTGSATEMLFDNRIPPGTGWKWPSAAPLVPEAVVPVVTKLVTGRGDGTDARRMLSELSRKLSADSLCTSPQNLCTLLRSQQLLPHNLYVVHQSTQPSLSAPLGWVLSATSQADLDSDLLAQATTACPDACKRGYPTLMDLTAVLTTS